MALHQSKYSNSVNDFRGKVSMVLARVAAQASPQTSPDQLTGADAGIRHVSDALTSLGLGMIPQAAEQVTKAHEQPQRIWRKRCLFAS